MKDTAIIIQLITSIYFMGSLLAQHPKAKELLAGFDNGASDLIRSLKDKKVVLSLRFLTDIFLIIGASSFVGLILFGALGVTSPIIALVLSISFMSSLLFGGSLLWVFKHKEIAQQFWGWFLFFGLGSMLFPVMDIMTNSNITHDVFKLISIPLSNLIELPSSTTFAFEALFVVGFYASGIVVFYLAGWIYSLPIALVGWICVILPIYISKFINKSFPEKPVVAVFIMFWFVSFLVVAYA